MFKKIHIYIVVLTILCFTFLIRDIPLKEIIYKYDWNYFNNKNLIYLILISIALNIIGHILRAYNSWILLKPIRYFRFKYSIFFLGIGYIFNLIFPLRFGEIVRIILIAKFLKISRLATFFSVFIERSIDLFVISSLSIILSIFYSLKEGANYLNTYIELLILINGLSILNIVIIFLLKNENKIIISIIYRITSYFNEENKCNIRFTIWALITWLNYVLDNKRISYYLLITSIMWSAYIFSVFNLLILVSNSNAFSDIIVSIGYYNPIMLPSEPRFNDKFQDYISTLAILYKVYIPDETLIPLNLIIWLVITLPIVVISIIWYLISGNKIFSYNGYEIDQHKRLWRDDGINLKLNSFLEAYFHGNEIFHLMRNFESTEKIKLIEIFKGGSNASTFLCESKRGHLFVRKCTTINNKNKLIDQYSWLKNLDGEKFIPKVFNLNISKRFSWYDLEYKKNEISLFEYIQTNPVNKSSRIIINLIEHLNNTIYNKNIEVYNYENLSKYINEKCISKIKEFNEIIGNNTITKFNNIFINGVEYPNLLIILNYINKNDNLIKKLAKYNQCNIHGDLTFENILISKNNFTLIDPNNENTVSSPTVDYAKLYQSLHMGYEFLCNLKSIEISNNSIRYQELTSNKTYEVYKLISSHLKMKLGVNDYPTIYFHEGIHFCRLLPYRARLNPKTALVFYAAAIRCFDVFINSVENIKYEY